MNAILSKREGLLGTIIEHLRTPLYRNGYALIMSTVFTSGIGFVYWIVAARMYSTEAVGLNSAVISTMMFLTTMAQLNMDSALNRYIPNTGTSTARFILWVYGITLGVAVVVGTIFVLGIELFAPGLASTIKDSLGQTFYFLVTIVLWAIFALQDNALVGLRQATWVPLENLIFAILKLLLLVAFAELFPSHGIFISWTVPVLLLIIPVNYLIFRRLIPWHHEASKMNEQIALTPRMVAKYIFSDYFGQLAWVGLGSILPLIILSKLGAEETAYYFVTSNFIYSFYLLSENMTMSLTTEGSATPKQLGLLSYNTFSQTIAFVVPIAIAVQFMAPYLIGLFGEDYGAGATNLMRVMSLSAIPFVIIANYLSVSRVRQKTQYVFITWATISFTILALSFVALEDYGIMAVGVIWLGVQTVVALFLLFTQLRPLWQQHLSTGLLRSLAVVPLRLWWRWINRRYIAQAWALVPHVQNAHATQLGKAVEWDKPQLLITESDTTVILMEYDEEEGGLVLKVPRTASSVTAMKEQVSKMRLLRANPDLAKLKHLIPEIVMEQEVDGQYFTVEQLLPGIEGRKLPHDRETVASMLEAAVNTIHDFHLYTAQAVEVDERLLELWVDQPLARIRSLLTPKDATSKYDSALNKLSSELHQALKGQKLITSWGHGDYYLGNLLLNKEATEVTGIIDWEQAAPDRLPLQDVFMLLIATRMVLQSAEMGTCVIHLLVEDNWTDQERKLLDKAQAGFETAVQPTTRQVLLLMWMHHISANLKKAEHYSGHHLWIRNNIESVLEVV